MRISKVLVVTRLELRRESRKRSIYLVIILMLLPLVAALIVRNIAGEPSVDRPGRLWAGILGFDPTLVIASAGIGAVSAVSLASWSWLIAALFGGDLYASDIEDGTARLLLYRDLSRAEYAAGKILALTGLLAASFLVAGLSTFAAAWIMAGRQEGFLEALVLSPLIGIGSLPIALLSSLVGLRTRRAVLGIILGIVAYFVSAIVTSVALVYEAFVAGDAIRAAEASYIVGSIIPLSMGSDWPSTIYSRMHDIQMTLPVPVHSDGQIETIMVTLDIGKFAPHLTVSIIGWSLGLALAVWLLMERLDF